MPSGLLAKGALALALSSVALAPFQCESEVDPSRATHESPAEALFRLAEQFKADGEEKARVRTLRHLIERYPSSRFARMAEQDLAAMGGEASKGKDD
jgi:hypothetical protein